MSSLTSFRSFAKQILQDNPGREDAFFIYDESILKQNSGWLRKQWQTFNTNDFKIFYSVKANPNPFIINCLSHLVEGFDVSSHNELLLLIKLGIHGERITASGPGKTDKFIELALQHNVHAIHVDSLDEYSQISYFKNLRNNTRLTLRLNTDSTGKLGFSPTSLDSLVSQSPAKEFSGLHAYTGRESFNAQAVQNILQTATKIFERHRAHFNEEPALYLGPGLPSLTPQYLAEDFWQEQDTIKPSFPIHLECGRALVGSSGCYVAPVLSVKETQSVRRTAIINGGLQHISTSLMSPILGDQFLQYEVLDKICLNSVPTALFGSLCLSHDLLHPDLKLSADLKRGDWLLLYPCGAYGITASANQFIGSPSAAEYLVNLQGKITNMHLRKSNLS